MRRLTSSLLPAAFVLLASACSNAGSNTETAKDSVIKMAADSSLKAPVYTVAMVDNKKDPSCGMPVSAGIGDTVHIQGKVIGFCSKECKEAFEKDTAAGLKKTEFKN